MKWSNWLLIAILCLAVFLRFYQLGNNPVSLDWDEVSLGYNAFSLLKTGSDEYGNSWPLSIRSFNDYKPPLYVYATIPFVASLGLTELAVRLPSAIAGVLAVASMYLLARSISFKWTYSTHFALAASFLFAISPWHLQFSRAAFEANIALTCYLVSVTAFLQWINQTKKTFFLLLVAVAVAAASLYAYHSARLVVPMAFLLLGVVYFKQLKQSSKQVIPALVIGVICLTPLAYTTLQGSTSQRFSTVSIFTNPGEFSRENERLQRNQLFKQDQPLLGKLFYTQKLVYTWIIMRNYFEHFNVDFFFFESDNNPRHHAYGMGLFYLIELPFLLAGLYYVFRTKKVESKVIAILIFVGPLASALTASTPHAIRSYMMLPGIILLIALGVVCLWRKVETMVLKPQLRYVLFGLIGAGWVINLAVYLNSYYIVSPYFFSKDWQYGYKEVVEKTSKLVSEYDRILITNYYDQPHIFFAFYQRIDPTQYQTFAEQAFSGFGTYSFKRLDNADDFQLENALIVVEPERTPANAKIIDTIHFLNGDVAFNLVSTRIE